MNIANFIAGYVGIRLLDRAVSTGGNRIEGIRREYLEAGFDALEVHTIDANEYLPAGSQVNRGYGYTQHKATRY